MGRADIDLPHAGVQPLERIRVLRWRDRARGHRLVVGPERDREAVTDVDTRLDPRFRLSYGAVGFGESPGDPEFELGAGVTHEVRDASKDVTREQAHGKPVRVVENNRVVDPEVKR
jgi:hypothetical protein